GLHELSCLIHDAQDDKKEFIADLKAAYVAFQTSSVDRLDKTEDTRRRLLDRMKKELLPLERFQSAMTSTPAEAGIALQRLRERAVERRESMPAQTALERERIPRFHLWHENEAQIERARELLESVQPDGVLANHPLRFLHIRFGQLDHPLATVHESLPKITVLIERILAELQPLNLPAECWDSLDKSRQLADYAIELNFLAEHELLGMLKAKSEPAKKLTAYRKKITSKEQELALARQATMGWRQKLSPRDARSAFEQATRQERSQWRFLQPSWWRLRGLLKRSYDFDSHETPLAFSQVLETLLAEHQRAAELEAIEVEARHEFSFEGSFKEFSERVASRIADANRLPPFLQAFHRFVLASPQGDEIVMTVVRLQGTMAALIAELDSFLADAIDQSVEQLRDEVHGIERAIGTLPGFVPFLKELGLVPAPLASAWRRFPLDVRRLEAAIVGRTLDELLSADPALAQFTANAQARQIDKLEPLHEQWYAVNAAAVRDRVCRRFLENLRIASLPHAQLTAEQKEFKTRYNRGRRELEHEFNKTMRFRSIRDLVDDETGMVVRDLKPIWLMSPLSVSDALPLAHAFDVVIFDEASQVTLEESIPTIFRSKQVLVVGDEMQLPPTSFFASRGDGDEEHILIEDASGQKVEYDLSSNSLLNHAGRSLPATMLGWHYRSRSESLISFSNAAFYQGRLLTVPEVALPPVAMSEIIVREPTDGMANVA